MICDTRNLLHHRTQHRIDDCYLTKVNTETIRLGWDFKYICINMHLQVRPNKMESFCYIKKAHTLKKLMWSSKVFPSGVTVRVELGLMPWSLSAINFSWLNLYTALLLYKTWHYDVLCCVSCIMARRSMTAYYVSI